MACRPIGVVPCPAGGPELRFETYNGNGLVRKRGA